MGIYLLLHLTNLLSSLFCHDTGNKIKYYDHHKHSAYIILHSNLYGISHKDLVMSAMVASMHRKGELDASTFMKYNEILIIKLNLKANYKI